MVLNTYGQEIGNPLADLSQALMPDIDVIKGNYCQVERLNVSKHFEDIKEFYMEHARPSDWTYMMTEPFEDSEDVLACLKDYEESQNPYFFAIRDGISGKIKGTFSLMRIDPSNRVLEMGRVLYAPDFQKTRGATEAQYLVMRYVFETLNYRRYEWKCDHLNLPSARAAQRLGFIYEGCFRNHIIYKGRSRDTDWFALTDADWQEQKRRFELWLAPENFDKQGFQIKKMSDF